MGLFDKIKQFVPDDLSDTIDAVKPLMPKKKKEGQTKGVVATQPSSSLQPLSSTGWSEGLENMVNMALEDGNLSDRELALLAKRAEKEGIDPDEFELTLRLKIKQRNREVEIQRNQNPVAALSQAFNMLEQYAKGGEKVVNGSQLSGVMALIPGVGQVAAVGGLLAAFIETPSNLNELKAEAIRRFVLPDNEDYLRDFIQYAGSQLEEEYVKSKDKNIKKFLSSFTVGSKLNLIPIWEAKIGDACDKAVHSYSHNTELMSAVKKYRPTLTNKLRQGRCDMSDGSGLDIHAVTPPYDDEDLLGAIAFLYSKKGNDVYWETAKDFHKQLYQEAERKFASNPEMKSKLQMYKIKKFGIF